MDRFDGERRPVLVVEADPLRAEELRECLMLLNIPARLVMTEEELLSAIRRDVFGRAIVAAELDVGDEPAAARVAALPSIRCLVVVGDGEDAEATARQCGATVYLPRPVTAESLAWALRPALATADAPQRISMN